MMVYEAQPNRIPEDWPEIECVMSNCDHSIDADIAARLQAEEAYAQYAAWDFCGYVWWDRTEQRWYCEIWRYNSYRETVGGATLADIMAEASEAYGHR